MTYNEIQDIVAIIEDLASLQDYIGSIHFDSIPLYDTDDQLIGALDFTDGEIDFRASTR